MRPIIKVINIAVDSSSTFFSLITLISWGNNDADVKIPAIVPITPVSSKNSKF